MPNLKKDQAELYNALKGSLETQIPVSIKYIVDDTLYPAVVVSQLSEPCPCTDDNYAVDIEGTFTIQYINGKQETLFCESERMYLEDWSLNNA
jgi:hypothetical protein